MNQHGLLPQQRFNSAAIAESTGLENIQTGKVGKQEVPDHRLTAINAPQKSRDALGVSASDQRRIFFRGCGNFCRLAVLDQIQKALAHRASLHQWAATCPSVSATEAARTASFDPFTTEPGLVRLE